MRYLLNSFSVQMIFPTLQNGGEASVKFQLATDLDALAFVAEPFTSRVGHESTAAIIAARLGIAVPVCRENSTLLPGDVALIAQYIGPRLAEGATQLPDGARIEWVIVEA